MPPDFVGSSVDRAELRRGWLLAPQSGALSRFLAPQSGALFSRLVFSDSSHPIQFH